MVPYLSGPFFSTPGRHVGTGDIEVVVLMLPECFWLAEYFYGFGFQVQVEGFGNLVDMWDVLVVATNGRGV